jgi:ATP-dependent exoDNAse (exonuclease V) beta subunit
MFNHVPVELQPITATNTDGVRLYETPEGNKYPSITGLYSDKYKVAGRVDCVAEYKGTLSIIDFKTSTKEKNDEWNENYYIQGSAYAEMFGERTGIEISQVVILVVTEDGTVQEFIKDKKDYLDRLSETINIWSEENVQ